MVSALDRQSVAPGKGLRVTGTGFNPATPIVVKFFDARGYVAHAPAYEASTSSLTVVVPPYVDTDSGDFGSALVNLQVVQPVNTQVRVSNIVTNFEIQAMPSPTGPAGSVTLAVLELFNQFLSATKNNLTALQTVSRGTISTVATRSALDAAAANVGLFIAGVKAIMAEPTASLDLGRFGGTPLVVRAADLARMDRLMAAYLIGLGPNSPSPCAGKEGPANAFLNDILHPDTITPDA